MPQTIDGKPVNEADWDKAKDIAKKAGQEDNYAYIMGVYKKMQGMSESITNPDKLRDLQGVLELYEIKFTKKPTTKFASSKDDLKRKIRGEPDSSGIVEWLKIITVKNGKRVVVQEGFNFVKGKLYRFKIKDDVSGELNYRFVKKDPVYGGYIFKRKNDEIRVQEDEILNLTKLESKLDRLHESVSGFYSLGKKARLKGLKKDPMYDEEYEKEIRFYPDSKILSLYKSWHQGWNDQDKLMKKGNKEAANKISLDKFLGLYKNIYGIGQCKQAAMKVEERVEGFKAKKTTEAFGGLAGIHYYATNGKQVVDLTFPAYAKEALRQGYNLPWVKQNQNNILFNANNYENNIGNNMKSKLEKLHESVCPKPKSKLDRLHESVVLKKEGVTTIPDSNVAFGKVDEAINEIFKNHISEKDRRELDRLYNDFKRKVWVLINKAIKENAVEINPNAEEIKAYRDQAAQTAYGKNYDDLTDDEKAMISDNPKVKESKLESLHKQYCAEAYVPKVGDRVRTIHGKGVVKMVMGDGRYRVDFDNGDSADVKAVARESVSELNKLHKRAIKSGN